MRLTVPEASLLIRQVNAPELRQLDQESAHKGLKGLSAMRGNHREPDMNATNPT
jgi:hypothetical protein